MPSQPPLDQIESLLEEDWDHGKLEAIDNLFAAEFTPHHSKNPVLSPAGTKQFVASFQEAFPDLELVIEDIFSSGDLLVICWLMHGTHTGHLMGIPPTRKCAQLTGISIYHLVEGRVVESWAQVDILSLLSQLDVLPM